MDCNFLLFLFCFCLQIFRSFQRCADCLENANFLFYYQNKMVFNSTTYTDDISKIKGCEKDKPWVIIVPGFSEVCEKIWIQRLIHKFTKYRGGCIACMDYSSHTGAMFNNIEKKLNEYVMSMVAFKNAVSVLVQKLKQFELQGFPLSKGHIFSFSYGAKMAIEAGRKLNGKLFGIDACDPAHFLFESKSGLLSPILDNTNRSAQNLQCIHTSGMFGTSTYDCDQNWRMGECGLHQHGAKYKGFYDHIPIPMMPFNHGMCVALYILAFEYDFPAVDNACCLSNRRANVSALPDNYKMGYMQRNKGVVQQKDLFALTFEKFPHNKP